ncbi:MAG: hypothetical protein JXB05_29295 [Myxococcaceae bacterium]|nr:hypothetical protein [Myxococcaceae bacterium]
MMRRNLFGALSGACLAMLSACKSEVHEETRTAYGYNEQGLMEFGQLSRAEWTNYMADQRYIHSLVRPDVRIRLNLADPKQHRFAMARLKLADKTPENSPYLFQAMERRRQQHLAKGYREGLLPQEESGLLATAERQEMHYIPVANAGETTAVTNDGLGAASSTFPGGTNYTYLDVSYTDASGYPLGSLGWTQEYAGGYNTTVNAAGDLSLTSLKQYAVASYKIEESAANGFEDSYLYTELGSETASEVDEVPMLETPSVEAPKDVAYNDNLISVCLNRTWTQDCDVDLTGTEHAVKLPLKGSIKIASSHVFNKAHIDGLREDLKNGVPRSDAGHVKLVLTNVGGGCDVTDGSTVVAKMAQFWNGVALSPDEKTLSWDLTGDNAAFFDEGCRQMQDRAMLSMIIPLPLLLRLDAGSDKPYRSSITLSNDPAMTRADYTLKDITITNSCLAAGTEIELAAGKSATIESLKAGDQVSNPYHPALTVMDTAVGFEKVPMVRIRSEAGRTLLMTEMHPIQVAGRGMVQAKALREGDVAMTKTGPSKLVEVSREAYDGKVYNVKVGSDAQKATLAEDQTVVYANGFMVGDGQIQRKYETLAMTRKDGSVLARLPDRWHRDYQMSTHGK